MSDSGSEADSNQPLTLRRSKSSSISQECQSKLQVPVKQESDDIDNQPVNETENPGGSENESSDPSHVNSKGIKRKRNLPSSRTESKIKKAIQDSSSDEDESSSHDKRFKNSKKNFKRLKSINESSDEESCEDKKLKKLNTADIAHKLEESSSSDLSDSEQDVPDNNEKDLDKSVASSNSDEDSDTPSPKTKAGKKTENDSKLSDTKKKSEKYDSRIARLQRYLKEAGIRVRNYKILWEGCKNNKDRAQKLLGLLENHGLRGNPTLAKCQKLKKKREKEEEIAGLNLDNIISSEIGRPRRGAFSLYASTPSQPLKEIKKTNQRNDSKDSPETNKHISRVKTIIDSEDSD